MKPVSFHPDAEAELLDAATFYESRSDGLGLRFLEDVEQGLAAIAEAQRLPELVHRRALRSRPGRARPRP